MSNLFTPVIESINPHGQGSLFVQKRIDEIVAVDTFAAKKMEGGLEALLLQVDPHSLAGIEEWPQSEGFQVILRPIDDGSGNKVRVCLELSSYQFRDVFHALGEDACKILAVESDTKTAVRVFHQRLYRWQEFLKRNSPDGLTPEKRTGLFGELLVLRELFLPHMNPLHAVRGWRGCKKANQDFQFPDLALEVKTTRAMVPDRINISNLQQLDEDGIETMFVTIVWVHQNETAGESLPEIVASVRAALPEPALQLMNEGLIEVGYLDVHKGIYESARYQVRDVMHFEVRDEFPRLTRDQIPPGVKGVKYQISVDACQPYSHESDEVCSAIKQIREDNSDG